MRKVLKDGFLLIFGIVGSGFVFSLYYTTYNKIPVFMAKKMSLRALSSNLKIPEKCYCTSDKSQERHNFCYIDPQNSSSIGKQFSCDSVKYLDSLGIFKKPENIVDLSIPTRNNSDVVFVSAISDNHYNEGETSFKAVRRFYPNQKYILYGLNLGKTEKKTFPKDANIEIRDFNFSKYPSYARNWLEYRFKPLIIAEVLQEYSNVFWIDAHITISAANITGETYDELAKKVKASESTPPLVSPIVFFVHSSHSNFAVLNPKLLEYFPTNSIALLKNKELGGQMGANVFYVARTDFSMEIVKWWVLCALDYECMNPPGAAIGCSFRNDRYNSYANCFRFDQSVINLLLLNEFQNYNIYKGSIGNKFNNG